MVDFWAAAVAIERMCVRRGKAGSVFGIGRCIYHLLALNVRLMGPTFLCIVLSYWPPLQSSDMDLANI